MSTPDPPLYDALRTFYGLNPRHRLREDHVPDFSRNSGVEFDSAPEYFAQPEPHPDPAAYRLPPEHVYAADDDPEGPPSPPLGEEPETPSSVVELVACERCRAPIVRVLNG